LREAGPRAIHLRRQVEVRVAPHPLLDGLPDRALEALHEVEPRRGLLAAHDFTTYVPPTFRIASPSGSGCAPPSTRASSSDRSSAASQPESRSNRSPGAHGRSMSTAPPKMWNTCPVMP